MRRSRGWSFGLGAAIGVLAGWALAQQRYVQHRQDLFHPRALRRLAALGYLAGQHGVATVRLLRDYVAWEPQPMLRRRGERILRRLEASLA
ncbi:MAG TPA: hypothetical protein VFN83_04620 [Gemmatimonadales bacterium]|jgi:hypothetical protein|nr:hypothetical protein [Gemmatimonadales bacterium]